MGSEKTLLMILGYLQLVSRRNPKKTQVFKTLEFFLEID